MTGESSEHLDPEERTGQRDQKEGQVSLETLALLDQMEKRVNWVFQGCQVTQEDKDPRDLRDFKDSQAPTERRAPGEQQANQAQEVREDQRDHVEREDPGVQQEKLDQRVTQEATAPQDLPANGVCQGLRAQLDSLDQRDLLDHLGKMDCPDTQGREERLVSKGRLDLRDLPVWLALRAPQVRLDQWETEVTLDPRAHQVTRDFQELPERKELREIQVLLAPLAKMVHPA